MTVCGLSARIPLLFSLRVCGSALPISRSCLLSYCLRFWLRLLVAEDVRVRVCRGEWGGWKRGDE